jgi:hypothetical protein
MNLPTFDYSRVQELKQLSYDTYGRPREEVEAEIRQRFGLAPTGQLSQPVMPDLPDAASLYR